SIATTLKFVVKNNGTIILNQANVSSVDASAGGTVKIKVSSYDEVDLSEKVTLVDSTNVIFILPNGTEIEGEGATMAAQSTYVYTASAEGENLWSTVTNWSLDGNAINSAPIGSIETPVVINLTAASTLKIDVADVVLSAVSVSGGQLTITGSPVAISNLASTGKVIVANELTLDAQGTEEAPTTVANQIEVANGGKLITKGYLNCTAVNAIAASGTLEVNSGVTSFGLGDRTLSGTLKVLSGAIFKNGTSDAPNYNQNFSPTLDIAGTLEVTGATRWSLSSRTTTILREGAVLKGSIGDNSYNYAYDYFEGATIEVVGNATIEGNIGSHNGGTITIDVAEDKMLTVSGKYDGSVHSGNAKLVVDGAGTVELMNTNTYTGGTEIEEGATVTITHNNALGTGTITGAGTLKCVEVLPANKTGLNAAAWTGTVLIKDFSGTLNQDSSGGSNAQIGEYGHVGSTIVLDNVKAYILNGVNAKSVTLTGEGFQPNNGSSTSLATVTIDKLKGDGALKGATGNSAFKYRFNITDATEFTGTINLATDKGSATSIYFGEDANATVDEGTIVVAETETVSIAREKTWRAYTDKSVIVSGTIGGTGTIGSTLTFNDGATLDASMGALTANSVTWNGTVVIQVPEDFSDWTTGVCVLKTSATNVPTNYKIKRGETTFNNVSLVAKTVGDVTGIYAVAETVVLPEVSVGEGDAVEVIEIAASNIKAIKAAAAEAGVTEITSIVGATIGDKTVDVAGLELFDDVAVTVDNSGKATVSYAFGITSIGLDADGKVTVTATVSKITDGVATLSNDSTNPKIASGVTVNLYSGDGTTPIGTKTLTDSATTVTITSTKSILDDLGTNPSLTKPLTIKAVKTQQQ
ncbi:MAG: hypothetical protein Q4C03_04625, partial [bacterium]|nr:hypothetical protein [bacterium]